MSADYWYRQSSRAGFNLTPIGFKGFSIFAFNLVLFAMPAFSLLLHKTPLVSAKGILTSTLLLASIFLFIYSLKYKSDYMRHDQN